MFLMRKRSVLFHPVIKGHTFAPVAFNIIVDMLIVITVTYRQLKKVDKHVVEI